MKKIFFGCLLVFVVFQPNKLQAFARLELYNDTNDVVKVELGENCLKNELNLRAKQQGAKTTKNRYCDRISFVATSPNGAQRKATIHFDSISGASSDEGIKKIFTHSVDARYYFAIKNDTGGEYVVKIPQPCGKTINDKLAALGYKISSVKTWLGTDYFSSKKGTFKFTEYRESSKDPFQPIK